MDGLVITRLLSLDIKQTLNCTCLTRYGTNDLGFTKFPCFSNSTQEDGVDGYFSSSSSGHGNIINDAENIRKEFTLLHDTY